MANDLTTTGNAGAPATADDLARRFMDHATSEGVADTNYLKFNGNDGQFTYGREGDELEAGTILAAAVVETYATGWICWVDGEVKDEIMCLVASGEKPPSKDRLPDHGPYDDEDDGWRKQAAILFKDPETGDQYYFKASSISGMRALAALGNAFGKAMKEHDPSKEVPLVELDMTSFEVKGKKKVTKHAPIFSIVDWMDITEIPEPAEAGDAEGDDDDAEIDQGVAETVSKAKAQAETKATRRRAKDADDEEEEEAEAKAPAKAQTRASKGAGRRNKRF
jgi:hypothetical protein